MLVPDAPPGSEMKKLLSLPPENLLEELRQAVKKENILPERNVLIKLRNSQLYCPISLIMNSQLLSLPPGNHLEELRHAVEKANVLPEKNALIKLRNSQLCDSPTFP